MLDVFSSIRGNLKFDDVNTDNLIFRMHYKCTFIILAVCSIMVTSRQYFGDPINCVVDGMPTNVMDTYCWIKSTFTLPNLHGGRVGKDVVQSGVGPYVEGEQEPKYHTYYQWVCFILFFQAVAFYVPRYAWKACEAGRVKTLLMDLNSPILDADTKRSQTRSLLRYFTERKVSHNFYALRFFACEAFNFVNVFAQMWLMDVFFGHEFTTYGIDVLRYSDMLPEDRDDPMARLFPKITKCTFHKYGPSGTIQRLDGLCILPLNILNEKIFIFLWVYFSLLVCASLCALIYRVTTLMAPRFRTMLLRSKSRLAAIEDVDVIVKKFTFGDWFILYQLGKNMNSSVFNEFLTELAASLRADEERTAVGGDLLKTKQNGLVKVNVGK